MTTSKTTVLTILILAVCIILVIVFAPHRADTLSTTTLVGGAGDIATTGSKDSETANLVKGVLASNSSAMAYTLGDMAYPNGMSRNFNNKYNPTWGDFKARTFPIVGNHEYFDGTGTAQAAKQYWSFQNDAYDLRPTYYSVALNSNWQFIALDSSKTETPKATGAPDCTTQ